MTKAPRPKRILVPNGIAHMLVGKDAVFVEAQGTVVRLDRPALKCRWEIEIGRGGMSRLIHDLLCTWSSKDVAVRACEDGRVLWSVPPAGAARWRDLLLTYDETTYEHRDLRTGEVLKVTEFKPRIRWSLGMCGPTWILLTEDGRFCGIEPDSGAVLWERDLWTETGAFAECTGSLVPKSLGGSAEDLKVVAGSHAGLFLVISGAHTFGGSVEDGSIRWHVAASTGDSRPTVADGRVYFTGGDRTVCLDEVTGAIVWVSEPPELCGSPAHGAAYREKNGTLYRDRIAFAYESGHLAVFNLEDGSLVSFYMAKSPLWCTGEADGRLLVTTDEAELLVFDESIWGL